MPRKRITAPVQQPEPTRKIANIRPRRNPLSPVAAAALRGRVDFAAGMYDVADVPAVNESPELATRENSENTLGLVILPNPNPVMRALGTDTLASFYSITYDPQVMGAINAMKADVMSMKYMIDRDVPGQTRQETDATRTIRRAFENFDEYQVRSDILNSKVWGLQPIEVIWKDYVSAWLPCRVTAKPAWWFGYTPNNEFVKFKIYSRFMYDTMPTKYRFLLPSHNASYDNPYGMALITSCYDLVKAKQALSIFWSVALEKYGMPWVDYAYDKTMHGSDEQLDADVAKFADMVQDGVFAHPVGETVQFAAPANQRFEGYELLMARCDADISKVFLSHGSAMDSTPGKLGNEVSIVSLAEARKLADKRLVEDTMNQLIRWIYEVNVADKTLPVPVYELYDDDDVDQGIAQRDKLLADAGVKFTPDYFYRTYGFQPGDISGVGNPAPTPLFASHTHGSEVTPAQAAIDNVITGDPTERAKQVANMVSPVLDKLDSMTEYGKMMSELASLYPNMPEEAFREEMERAIIFATTTGRQEVQQETKAV